MHDVGMNMSQLAMSVKQVDDTIELAHEWSHQLLHATENFGQPASPSAPCGCSCSYPQPCSCSATLHQLHG